MTSALANRSTKDSGIPWIGQMPLEWTLRRYKHVFKERDERSHDGSEILLSVSAYTGVSPRSQSIEDGELEHRAATLEGYKICYAGDLVMNIMLAWNRAQGISAFDGIVSPAYSVFSVIDDSDRRFLNYLVRCDTTTAYFKAWSYGIIESRLRLYPETFGSLRCALPSRSEQSAIADYLDRATARIDTLVAKKTRFIELLREKRQALITQAVTKGLDPSVPMKDSGVEWLGKVPAHWTIPAIRHLVSTPITDGPHETPVKQDHGVRFISAEAVSGGMIDFSKAWGFISEEDDARFAKKYKPEINDIYMIKSGATTGVVAIVEDDADFNIWSPLAAIRPNQKVVPKFLLYALRSAEFQAGVALNWSYGTQQNIGMKVLEGLPVPIPPRSEQESIVEHLDRATSRIDILIAKTERSIELLREHRTALITAAVTGKIDLREAA